MLLKPITVSNPATNKMHPLSTAIVIDILTKLWGTNSPKWYLNFLEPHVPNTSNIQSPCDMIVKFRVLKLWNAALNEQLTFHSRNEFTPGIRSHLLCDQSGSFAILL